MPRLTPPMIAQLLLLAVVLVWGATFVLVKDALRDSSPLLFNLMRMILAAVVLAAANYKHLRGLSLRTMISGAVVGCFLAAGYQFQTAGLARTTAAKAAFITGLVVVFVPLFTAIPALRPRGTAAPRWPSALGAALAFAGLLLLTTPPGTVWSELFASIGAGDLLVLCCAVAFAGHLIALAHLSPRIPAPQMATIQIGVAAIVMLATLPLGGRPHAILTMRLTIALAVTSIIGTAAAFTIQSWAQKHLAPTHTAIILSLEPAFAWLTALLFLQEHLGVRGIAGAGLIFAGIAVIELTPAVRPVQVPV